MENNLKDYREKELTYYVVGNVLIIMLLTGVLAAIFSKAADDTSGTLLEVGKEILSAGIISTVFYVYVFIFDSIIPGNWKDKICNLFRLLPGETVFEDIAKGKIQDKRFTKEEAGNKYKAIYSKLNNSPEKTRRAVSNSAWYKIYLVHEKETKIFISNRDYLLCRDLCVVTLWIAVVYAVLASLSIISFSYQVVLILIIEAIITNIAMRGKQKRFVCNVIAVDIHSKDKGSKENKCKSACI